MTDETQKPDVSVKIPPHTQREDFEMNTTVPDSSRVMLIGTIVILVVAIVGGVIAIAPKVKTIGAQKEKIADLEAELAAAKTKQAPSQVEAQLQDVQAKMNTLTDAARQIQSSVANGDMQGKLNDLETKFNQVVAQSHAMGLTGMMAKIQSLQQSPQGAAAVSGLVALLAQTPEGQDVGESFEALRTSDPNVAQMAEGVAPEDMKAAAMLMAFSQLRSSLLRNNDSFDEDLALLKKTVPADNPQLIAAIDRLAPQAKHGVLTPSGLSQELRGMTGDIVAASLSGQDVSFREKARARMANVFHVEKGGRQVSGTESQIAIAAAQAQLNAGNVQGAVEILQTLKGPAAVETQPLIEKAQATVLAGNLQTLIGQNLPQTIKAGVRTLVNGGLPNGIVNPYGAASIGAKIQSLVPEQSLPQPAGPGR